jgi:pyruvate formate lyase activating enzyme
MTDNYAEAVSVAIDPIEKKPLYHFYPGTTIVSTGPNGCNLACRHCQNWSISQRQAPTTMIPPEEMARLAGRHGSIGLAFTYTEPVIWIEYIMDVAPLLRKAGLKVVLVSNGYINQEPLGELLPLVDAVNFDLKSIRPEFYRRICGGHLEGVKAAIATTAAAGVHLELTNLLIPGLNDSEGELTELVEFIASISDRIPLHLSAYHPSYQMNLPATSAETMERAFKIASARLRHVYVGNIHLPGCANTICPACGAELIRRSGYETEIVGLDQGKCVRCDYQTGIVM